MVSDFMQCQSYLVCVQSFGAWRSIKYVAIDGDRTLGIIPAYLCSRARNSLSINDAFSRAPRQSTQDSLPFLHQGTDIHSTSSSEIRPGET
jgi:hypothetical protein